MSPHTKHLGSTVAIIAAFTLGACGGGGSSTSATKKTTPATAAPAPTDAVQLATRLGCTNPVATFPTPKPAPGLPEFVQYVSCNRGDWKLNVYVLTPDGMRFWKSSAGQAQICDNRVIATDRPRYFIAGADFIVFPDDINPAARSVNVELARDLKLPVTTICG